MKFFMWLILFISWAAVASVPTMTVVYATVNNISGCTPIFLNWKRCVQFCASSSDCVLTVKTTTGCSWCEYGVITTTHESTTSEIGYKIDLPPGTCANPDIASTGVVNNQKYTVELINGIYTFTYM